MSARAAYIGFRRVANGPAKPQLCRVDTGSTDDASGIVLRAEPNPAAPAGSAGECVFSALHLTLTWTMPVTLVLVPILDGVERGLVEQASLPLEAPEGGARETRTFEIAFGYDAIGADGQAFGRFAYRGTWFSFRLWTPGGLSDGDLIIDRAVLKGEVVRESREATNAG